MIADQTAQNTAAASATNVALVSSEVTVQLTDTTAVQSDTWANYKATAMAEGFSSSTISDAAE